MKEHDRYRIAKEIVEAQDLIEKARYKLIGLRSNAFIPDEARAQIVNATDVLYADTGSKHAVVVGSDGKLFDFKDAVKALYDAPVEK